MTAAALPNRVQLLTPPGGAAIAVIRIAGDPVAPFLAAHFSRPVAPLRCVHGDLRDERGEVIDDALVVLHEGGRTADLNVHGGPWVVSSVLELLRRSGFDVGTSDPTAALPLALVDGCTVLEREVAAHLPLASTEQGLRMLLAQPAAWVALAASPPGEAELRRIAADRCLDRLLRPARVAIIGPPNVGKSTLANQLFGQERSITADVAGTTRDWVGELANVDGVPVVLVDTPGVRATTDPVERTAIERSGGIVRAAELVVLVLDASEEDAAQEEALIGSYPDAVVVLNKADQARGATGLRGDPSRTVATTGEGVDALRTRIRERLGCADLAPQRPRCWTERQRELLARALIGESSALQQIIDHTG